MQDLQRVTCEKLELASHVTGLEEEVERSREELHHTRDQLDRLQQAGRPLLLVQILAGRCFTKALMESTLSGGGVLRTLLS